MLLTRALSASILGATLLALGAPARAQSLAITGATVIDGTGKPPVSDGVVLIAAGRIAAVGAARDVTIPSGARRLDVRGKYVIPGLMDANLHLMLNIDLETLIRYGAATTRSRWRRRRSPSRPARPRSSTPGARARP